MARIYVLLMVMALLAASCSSPSSPAAAGSGFASDVPASNTTLDDAEERFQPGTIPGTTLLDYRDGVARSLDRQAREPRPVANSAMPPRHLNDDLFPELLVERFQIVSGGPPPDGIPSIDEPSFTVASNVDFLDDAEAVLLVDLGGTVRVYPVQILLWHEIVNDSIDGRPITVTFCPLCNSAVAFDRRIAVPNDIARPDGVELGDEVLLDFGTSGAVHHSALVMYDRQTESLWTHFDGNAVVGTLMGVSLDRIPVATVSWGEVLAAHPDAEVLDHDSGFDKPYGRNRYVGYDQSDRPLAGFFSEEIPEPIPSMERVVGVRLTDGAAVAVPRSVLAKRGVVDLQVGGALIVVFWEAGANSPLQHAEVAAGDDIGAVSVFDPVVNGEALSFMNADDGGFVDSQTRSSWTLLGRAISGPLAGEQLEPLEHLDTFWFAWVAHHPGTELMMS